MPDPRVFHLILRSYDYNMHVEGLLPANLCLVTLLSFEQCSKLENFRLQHVQIVNKTSRLKTKLIVIMPKQAELSAIPIGI